METLRQNIRDLDFDSVSASAVSFRNDVVNKLPWCFMHLHEFQPMSVVARR